jgi:hypothetical protein
MWGLFVGVTWEFVLYSFYVEWQQRWPNKKRLADMRKNLMAGRHFDATKGQWSDDRDGLGQTGELTWLEYFDYVFELRYVGLSQDGLVHRWPKPALHGQGARLRH